MMLCMELIYMGATVEAAFTFASGEYTILSYHLHPPLIRCFVGDRNNGISANLCD